MVRGVVVEHLSAREARSPPEAVEHLSAEEARQPEATGIGQTPPLDLPDYDGRKRPLSDLHFPSVSGHFRLTAELKECHVSTPSRGYPPYRVPACGKNLPRYLPEA